MGQAGVIDLDAACVLLRGRIDLGEELDEESIARGVESLLLDKPFLRASQAAPLPPATASARTSVAGGAAQLAQAAEQAARSGGRRDIANYLRLRRQAVKSGKPAGRQT